MARQRGQATVELALALPVIVLLILLVLQMALVAGAQVLVVGAAREGARAAAVEGTAAAATRAAQASPGMVSSRVEVDAQIDRSPGGLARVRVTYRVPTDVPLVGALLGDPTVHAEVVMRVEEPAMAP